MIARGLVALAIAVPWLAIVGLGETLLVRTLLVTLTLLASCHGYGAMLGVATDRRPAAAFAIAWGLACLILFGGILLWVHVSAPRAVILLGVVLHSGFLASQFSAAAERLHNARWRIVPAALASMLGVLVVLGAARVTQPFDDDGHVLAQITRVLGTGSLEDTVGYARGSQLGAHVVLGTYAAAFRVTVLDGFGFLVLVGLVVQRMHVTDAASSLLASLVLLALGSFAFVAPDPVAPLWLPIALVVACFVTLVDSDETPDGLIPLALLIGALGCVRLEWWPIGLVLGFVGVQLREPRGRITRIAVVSAGVALVMLPYVIASMGDRTLVPPLRIGGLGIALACAVVAMPLAYLAGAGLGRGALRWWPVAAVAAFAGIAGRVTTSSPYGYRYLMPIAAVTLLVLVIELARQATRRESATLVATFALVFAVYVAREERGTRRWSTRAQAALDHASFLASTQSSPNRKPYATLLENVPRGAIVAVAVAMPQQLDYATHRIVDVRTPRAIHRETAVLARSGAAYLLTDGDDQVGGTLVAERDGVRLFALRR